MKRAFNLLLLFSQFAFQAIAQLNEGGIPISLNSGFPKISSYYVLPEINLNNLQAEDRINDTFKDIPWRFGENIDVNLNPSNSGFWTRLNDGSRVWRLGIFSRNAHSLNLTFSKFCLPPGAKLFLFNSSGSQVLGAYTNQNNQIDSLFATSLIFDDSLQLEYFEPKDVVFIGKLNICRVTHGYRNVVPSIFDFGDAQSCEINVACTQANNYRKQVRSIALLVLNGNTTCTGALINNTNKDGRPFLLSANHCLSSTPGTIVFWFNWQGPTCTNPAISPSYKTLTGATTRANFATSDFWLLELNQEPPSDYNVFYAGWNRTTASSLIGISACVHHPIGDIKKISLGSVGLATSDYKTPTGDQTSHWKLAYWDAGTTEVGSSGAPLFDSNGRIIGQLHGGLAACGNQLEDYFGKFGRSWTGGGQNNNRLSNWLNPAGSTSAIFDGFDPNDTTDVGLTEIVYPLNIYTENVTVVPTFEILNNGNIPLTNFTVGYTLDGSSEVNKNWNGSIDPGNTEKVTFPAVMLIYGKHTLTANVYNPDDKNHLNDSLSIETKVVSCENYEIPLEEGFNTGTLPTCWTTNLITTGDIPPKISYEEIGIHPLASPREGSRLIEFNSYSNSDGSSIRLVSPTFTTLGYKDLTTGFYWHNDKSYNSNTDRVVVQYSTDNQNWINIDTCNRYVVPEIFGWSFKSFVLADSLLNLPSITLGYLFISGGGNNCHMDSVFIHAEPDGPFVYFFANPVNAYLGDTILFSDASGNANFSNWDWNFGVDATPSSKTGKGPHKVVYHKTGYKDISLTVDDSLLLNRQDYIFIDSAQFEIPDGLVAFEGLNNTVNLFWNRVDFFDDFESQPNFSLEMENWFQFDLDSGYTYGITDCDFTNQNYKGAFISFNTKLTNPPLNDQKQWEAHSGTKYAACFNVDQNFAPNNDWLITPRILVGNGDRFRFWVRGSSIEYGSELLKVGLSTTTPDVESFNFLSGNNPIEIGPEWRLMDFELAPYVGDSIYLAINCVSNDAFALLIDDVVVLNTDKDILTETVSPLKTDTKIPQFVTKREAAVGKIIPVAQLTNNFIFPVSPKKGYRIYRNDELIGQTEFTEYLDFNLKPGIYTYYVTSVYSNPNGESKPSNPAKVNIPLSVPSVLKSDIFKAFPNPTEGNLFIECDWECNLSVYSLEGEEISNNVMYPGMNELDLNNKPTGVYILRVIYGNTVSWQKITVK